MTEGIASAENKRFRLRAPRPELEAPIRVGLKLLVYEALSYWRIILTLLLHAGLSY